MRKAFLIVLALFSFYACTGASDGLPDGSDDAADDSADDSASPGNSEGGSTSTGNPVNSLTFDLQGAVGLALEGPDTEGASLALEGDEEASSNLRRVNIDNTLAEAVTSGSVTVESLMVAANDQVYLLLSEPVESCLLIRVDGNTDEATCVDATLAEIVWDNAFGNPIQFDGDGNIYYAGVSEGQTVLRENASGSTTDLINENISLTGFLVLEDGTVFLSGQTVPTGLSWTRIIWPDDSLENLLIEVPTFLALFPDENIYLGLPSRVARYLTTSGELDPVDWIGDEESATFLCPEGIDCNDVRALLRTSNGRVYVNTGGRLVEYYPQVAPLGTSVVNVTIARSILTYLVLAGLDAELENRLVLYGTNDDSEVDLLGEEEIEVYHINYLNLAGSQVVMFDGLRFSDRSYVLCQANLTQNNVLTCSKTHLGRLLDFQLFDE